VDRYLAWLKEQTGRPYRLPTEAEWEYAARAGTSTPFSFGACISTAQANYNGNYDYNDCGAKTGVYLKRTQPVGSYPANSWGLYDMHGNVYEWTADWYGSDYYATSPRDNPRGPSTGSLRVNRGGGWISSPWNVRAANRYVDKPGDRDDYLGFRLLLPEGSR
jgi:formylglycine-generating enzyme required for sulfatase activity